MVKWQANCKLSTEYSRIDNSFGLIIIDLSNSAAEGQNWGDHTCYEINAN